MEINYSMYLATAMWCLAAAAMTRQFFMATRPTFSWETGQTESTFSAVAGVTRLTWVVIKQQIAYISMPPTGSRYKA